MKMKKKAILKNKCLVEEIAGLEERCRPLVQLCLIARGKEDDDSFPPRNYLRELYKEATGMEEYIDRCGAQKNELWYPFREAVAALKMFSHLYYDLLHIREATPSYSLLAIEGDFSEEVQKTLKYLRRTVFTSTQTMEERVADCGLYKENSIGEGKLRGDDEPLFRFPADRKTLHVKEPGKIVVHLATQFLNLTEDRDVQEVLRKNQGNIENIIPSRVNEEILRIVTARFHNLQAHYDTRIFESDIEGQDSKLKVLRSHISVIYHLLEIATDLAHYYERHIGDSRRRARKYLNPPIGAADLLNILFNFTLTYVARYLKASGELCRNMILSYAVEGKIQVSIPCYRGFHVRPSTLISKIVAHYGSRVQMFLDGQEYDAGITLDLFRANEAINAYKRRYIASVIERVSPCKASRKMEPADFPEGVRRLFRELRNQGEIILYTTKLEFNELSPSEDETTEELACQFIKIYMTLSKLDVKSDLKVEFQGDIRVLKDLELLAKNGYGEDEFGNNILLPKALEYLRQ